MYGKTLTLDPTRLDRPGDPIEVYVNSAGMLTLIGIPSAMTSAVFVIVPATGDPIVLAVDPSTPALLIENGAHTAVGVGNWYVYGLLENRLFGLGSGIYNIMAAPTLAALGTVTQLTNNAVVPGDDGLYYRFTATRNELGQVTFDLSQTGEAP